MIMGLLHAILSKLLYKSALLLGVRGHPSINIQKDGSYLVVQIYHCMFL